jgi:hypothetical protein
MAKPMKETKTQTMKQRHNWYMIRIVLGAYLIYLAWQIGSEVFSGNAKDNIILLGIAVGVFGVFGVVLIILNIRLLRTDRTSDNEDMPPEDKIE